MSKVTSLLLVGMNSAARAAAVEASWMAFPVATLTDVATIDEALRRAPAPGPELLLLCEPDTASLAQAVAAPDALGLRRWAVVVFGTGVAGTADAGAALPPEDWKARTVAPMLQSALRLHLLERENARLRGDLSTLGRRISHDLRTPLTGVYSACEAIDEMAAEQTTDPAAFTQSIVTSADELVQLIGRVSFVLKATAEPAAKEPVIMGETIFATLQRLEKRLLKKGAVVTQPAGWPVVKGIAGGLEMIWLNLIGNALQHAGPAPAIVLGWSETQGEFRFWVEDRGPGVAREKLGKLFQPFNLLHRLDAPRGLGLALVQRLVELQGGRCGHEVPDGGGARFFFTLPAGDPA